MENHTNISTSGAKETINSLNTLLANFQIYYQNLRGFHWNIKGPEFFELHVKFEEFYNSAALKIDEIAERILTLGGTPEHTFEDYLKISSIQSVKGSSNAKNIMEHLWNDHKTLLSKLYETINTAAENDDEGTQDLISPMISDLEKTNWMVGAYLGK